MKKLRNFLKYFEMNDWMELWKTMRARELRMHRGAGKLLLTLQRQ